MNSGFGKFPATYSSGYNKTVPGSAGFSKGYPFAKGGFSKGFGKPFAKPYGKGFSKGYPASVSSGFNSVVPSTTVVTGPSAGGFGKI